MMSAGVTRFPGISRRWALGAWVGVPLLLLASPAPAQPNPTEQARIDRLIALVAARSDLIFIRNGSRHNAADAAAHLQLKLRRGASRISTAEQFIDHLASSSSFSGQRYRIVLGAGAETDAGAWLHAQLRQLDAADPAR